MLDFNNPWLHWCLEAPIEKVLGELRNRIDGPALDREQEVWNIVTSMLPIVIAWIRDLYGMGIQPPALHKWVGQVEHWQATDFHQDISLDVQTKIKLFLQQHKHPSIDDQIHFSVAGLIVADLLTNGHSHAYYGELLVES